MKDIDKVITKNSFDVFERVKAFDKTMFFEKQIREKWLSTEEASRYLCLTQNAIRIMVYRKRLKAFKLGRRLRFRLSDLDDLLEKREVIYG